MMEVKRHILSLVCLLSALLLSAGPARRTPLTFTQPDGTSFGALVRGDEHLHIITDIDGHALIRNGDGFWCYAYYNADGTKVSSGHVVGEATPGHVLAASTVIPYAALSLRTRARREEAEAAGARNRTLFRRIRTQSEPEEGPAVKHSIVILAEFRDQPMTYSQQDFIDMLTVKGYSRNGAAGSAMDYFDEMFRGDCHFEFTVSPVVTLNHSIGYYFANDENGQDRNPAQAVADACRKAHDQFGIDFSQFDDDGDGIVDNVIVFVAGKDEAEHPDEEQWVWSHAWSLRSAGISCELDGKRIDSYAVTSEIRRDAASGKDIFATIGTFCHEFSHTFGLPDLYDTDYEGSGGQSNGLFLSLGLMDAGNYNSGGNIPPHYSALDYHILGLGTCEDIGPGVHTLEPISVARRYLRYETGNEGEYFLFECRDNTGWDQAIGGKGLLVYHVDRSKNPAGHSDRIGITLTARERWSAAVNEVNANPVHECARLITATPGIRAYTSDGYDSRNQPRVFYPQNSYKSFTPQTDPPFVTWAGKEASISLVNIAFAKDGAVSFTVLDESAGRIPTVTGHREEIFQDGAILQWTASDPGFMGKAVVEWGASSAGTTETIEILPYAPGQYALVLTGLEARTPYRAQIRFERDGMEGDTETVAFLTKSFPDNGIAYIVLPAAGEGQTFPAGTEIPLHVNNARNVEHVDWTFDGRSISVGGNGYHALTKSGTLKAVITRKDGSRDFIIKELTVK